MTICRLISTEKCEDIQKDIDRLHDYVQHENHLVSENVSTIVNSVSCE
jgi:chorismate mutase